MTDIINESTIAVFYWRLQLPTSVICVFSLENWLHTYMVKLSDSYVLNYTSVDIDCAFILNKNSREKNPCCFYHNGIKP